MHQRGAGRDQEMTVIGNDVLAVLSTVEIDGTNVKIPAQLDRKLYMAVNKVLDRIGGKWNRKAKAHVFDADPTKRLEAVIETGILDPEVKTGYFPTPPEIIDRMIGLADFKSLRCFGMILEPSAGQGHIVEKIKDQIDDSHCRIVHICENLPENVHILEEKGYQVQGEFFNFALECDAEDVKFNRVLMNPPFERQADIDHVTTAFDLLAPGGILVAIMSSGVTFRKNKKTIEFRENIVEPNCTHLEHLPSGAFKESGTMVNTILIRLER